MAAAQRRPLGVLAVAAVAAAQTAFVCGMEKYTNENKSLARAKKNTSSRPHFVQMNPK